MATVFPNLFEITTFVSLSQHNFSTRLGKNSGPAPWRLESRVKKKMALLAHYLSALLLGPRIPSLVNHLGARAFGLLGVQENQKYDDINDLGMQLPDLGRGAPPRGSSAPGKKEKNKVGLQNAMPLYLTLYFSGRILKNFKLLRIKN